MEKITCSLDSDTISNLPRNVTDTVLTCLPLRDAVRTSILSKKWRYCWMDLPKLVFDETMCQVSVNNELLARYKLISIIYQVLLLHRGPLLKFSLSHPVLESCPEIDNFIMFLSKSRVEEFNLNILKGEKYKMPSSFFSCRELTHLNVSSCVFTPPPDFKGFRRLTSLKFVNVVLATDLFKSFVSTCAQLEKLTLINPSRFHCLGISAPNLKYLHLEGTREQIVIDESEEDIHLKEGEKCRLAKFFRGLPALTQLITNFVLLEKFAADGVPKKLPTSINLKILKLSEISLDALGEMSILFSLIGSSPSIQRIEIEAYPPLKVDVAPVLDFLKALDCPADIILDELREVQLTSISGMEPELEFIKILLSKSPVLETMLIKPKLDDVVSRLELLKKLTRFQRSSPTAEIVYE